MENNRNARAVASPYYRGLVDTTYVGFTDEDHDGIELNSPQFSPNTLDMQHRSDGFYSRLVSTLKLFKSLVSVEEATPEETTNHYTCVTVDNRFPPSNQALSRNHIHELETDTGYDDHHRSHDAFHAIIDIWDEGEYVLSDATAHQLTHQAWKHHINELKRSGVDESSMKMMSETAAALGGQAIGVVVANALANGPTASGSSWAVHCVEFVIVLGLCCTVAGIGLRRRHRAMSVLMTKVGAIATIASIIIPLASHLPPVMTWTVGPLAFLVSAFAVALA